MSQKLNISVLLFLIISLSLPAVTSAADLTADYTDLIVGMEFMAIPGGTFVMGNNQGEASTPEHEVTIEPFMIGRYEVTFEQYAKFCSSTKRPLPSDEGWGAATRPVINVSWHDAVAFAEWLSEITGRSFRLPSESEWEYAARAGTSTLFYWGDAVGRSNANCSDCGTPWDGKKTAEVGSFSPNPFGLFDIIGNVYEWTNDFKHPNYNNAPTDGSAWTDSPDYQFANLRVTRGGSWGQPYTELKSFVRCWDGTTDRTNEVGFRLVMVP